MHLQGRSHRCLGLSETWGLRIAAQCQLNMHVKTNPISNRIPNLIPNPRLNACITFLQDCNVCIFDIEKYKDTISSICDKKKKICDVSSRVEGKLSV